MKPVERHPYTMRLNVDDSHDISSMNEIKICLLKLAIPLILWVFFYKLKNYDFFSRKSRFKTI